MSFLSRAEWPRTLGSPSAASPSGSSGVGRKELVALPLWVHLSVTRRTPFLVSTPGGQLGGTICENACHHEDRARLC